MPQPSTARVALVAGPDAGHAFPAFALAERLAAAGRPIVVFTGPRWRDARVVDGVEIAELPGLAVQHGDDDGDAGAKLSHRAARIAVELAPVLGARGIELVISDVITVGGGWAAELTGIPWLELSPHPLYRPSRGLPPIGSGLEPGVGWRGRLRDTLMRAATARSVRGGERQRSHARAGIGLRGPGGPAARLIATLPALEVSRPDWPADTHVVGPLLWEPTDEVFDRPPGIEPLVLVAPSTADTGVDLTRTALAALTDDELGMPVRVVVSALQPPEGVSSSERVVVGTGRQDEVLAHARAVVCGGGHGMLAKALAAGVPVVTVPGGGDQWELANRVRRQGGGLLVRPLEVSALADAVRQVLVDPVFTEAAERAAATRSDVLDPVPIVEKYLPR
ncbi:nucleotide disphospho-sugar-binding domain-containing protein [Gordonia sp. CPCC 205515]|uniref:glycosyltransferase n=1 Tax=Gordonia sp. CPCC 205515 TaxID=3140791 RepID=UPI003AF3A947